MPSKFLIFFIGLCGLIRQSPVVAAEQRSLNGISSSLTVYMYPPRHPISWKSPESALSSIIHNVAGVIISKNDLVAVENSFGEKSTISSNYKSSMGHTLAHVRCTLPNGELYDHWASFSGEDYAEEDKQMFFRDKIGFGALFHNYVDGHIISGEENIKRITFYRGRLEGFQRIRPRYLQVEIDSARCARTKKMIDFFESFHFAPETTLKELQARKLEDKLFFTNQIDPYESYIHRIRTGHGEVGGGCAPFGAALLKIVGRYDNSFEESWKTPVSVSEKLIGGEFDPRIGAVRRVPIGDILFSPLGDRWSYEDEGYPNRNVNMYDPQKIWESSGRIIECLKTRNCSIPESEFLDREFPRLQLGEVQVFRDSVNRRTGETGQENGIGEHSGELEHVTQPVQGFVWYLK